jgi:hypothetical protein
VLLVQMQAGRPHVVGRLGGAQAAGLTNASPNAGTVSVCETFALLARAAPNRDAGRALPDIHDKGDVRATMSDARTSLGKPSSPSFLTALSTHSLTAPGERVDQPSCHRQEHGEIHDPCRWRMAQQRRQ